MGMQNLQTFGAENTAADFLQKLDAGMSERRLLEEIGKLSCDELAEVLLLWSRAQGKALSAAN